MSLRQLLPVLSSWQRDGVGFGRAVLIRSFRSSPRVPGAVLLASDDGRIEGSVSGGCVEGAVADEVRRARQDGVARVVRYGISDDLAWDVGLACGGTVDVLIEPEVRPEAIAAAEADGAVLATRLPADAPGDELAPARTGAGEPPSEAAIFRDKAEAPQPMRPAIAAALGDGASGVVRDAAGRQWFVEAFPSPPRLVIVGAVHTAIPLLHFAAELGYRTVVVDRRATFVGGGRMAEADEVHVSWPEDAFAEIGLGREDAVAILSHDAKLDEPAIVAAIRAGCRYVGAIGSRKTQSDRRRRLLDAGLTEAELGRLRGPIGLQLGGRAPGEIALAVMAQIIADRYGAPGAHPG
jgi:xanthine dehydrogenase accessory factor